MAAWSDEPNEALTEARKHAASRIVKHRESRASDYAIALSDSTTSDNHCPECGEYESECECVSTPEIPATPSEAFPIEVWTFFSDSDLDQLVVDACAEMGRRELGRKLKPCRFCDSTRAAKFEDSDVCSDKDAYMKRIHHA